jgi:hypothetical protein
VSLVGTQSRLPDSTVQLEWGSTRIAGGDGGLSFQGGVCMLPTTLQAVLAGERQREVRDI